MVPPHPAALFVANRLGADIGSVIIYDRRLVGLLASVIRRPAVLKSFWVIVCRVSYVPTEFWEDLGSARRKHPAVAGRNAVYRSAADWPDAGENRQLN